MKPSSIAPEGHRCGARRAHDDDLSCMLETAHPGPHATEPSPGETIAWHRTGDDCAAILGSDGTAILGGRWGDLSCVLPIGHLGTCDTEPRGLQTATTDEPYPARCGASWRNSPHDNGGPCILEPGHAGTHTTGFKPPATGTPTRSPEQAEHAINALAAIESSACAIIGLARQLGDHIKNGTS